MMSKPAEPVAPPGAPWIGSLQLRLGLLVLVLVGTAASALLFYTIRMAELEHINSEFERDARDRISAVAEEVGHSLQGIVALESLYTQPGEIRREDFERFSTHLFEHHPSTRALEWIEKVLDSDRLSFETAMRGQGHPDFHITERDPSGRMVRAAERPVYFPVTFVEPWQGNEAALGFDLGSETIRLEAMRKAEETGQTAATERLDLVQDAQQEPSFLVFSPVFLERPLAGAGRELGGFILGVFRIPDIIEAALSQLEARGVDLAVYDSTAPGSDRLLHFHASRMREVSGVLAPEGVEQASEPRTERVLQVADREWRIVANPTVEYVASRRTWLPWGTLLGGLLLTLLLASRMLAFARRSEESRAFAERLQRAKEALEEEVEERRRAEAVAVENEVRYRSLAESTFNGVAISEDGTIVEINAAFARTFGYQAEEMIGVKVAEQLVAPEQRDEVLSKMAEQYDKPYETICLHKDGTRFPVEACGRAIPYQGRIARVTAIRDLSDQKRAERERTRSEKLSSLGVLAGGLAHDFNNLLTVILGNIDLARLDARKDSALEGHLVEAEQASRRAAAVTRQLLTFSRGGAPVRRVAKLDQLVREAAIFTSRGSNVKCEFDVAEDLWSVEVDSGQISQVLGNLILNAIQAMPQGGTVRVSGANQKVGSGDTSSLDPGSYVRIEVADSGVGILPEHLERVFDPYFSTKQEGSGLGLATAYSIVQQHHGLITVDSEVGVGTTFTLILPASDQKPAGRQEAAEPPLSGRGRILVMDDEEGVRGVVSSMLTRLGYQVECANDGEQAIEIYRAGEESGDPFAAVILDLTVQGGMGGLETLQGLREYDPEVRALVASGYSNDPVLANHAEHGFLGRVAKPFRGAELGEILGSVLAARAGEKVEPEAS